MEFTGQKYIVDVYWAGHSTIGPILHNPALLSLTSLAMAQKPAHPHAAALLYDFMISKEGQEEVAKEDNVPVRDDVEIKAKGLGPRMKEARAQKKFRIQSPATYDPAVEEKLDHLYINTLVKKSK
jgi:ABC-type Fe3+ transport system substrate-binding protein